MIVVAAAVVWNEDRKVLLCSRPENKPPAGWEFPGGKVEPGESFAAALEREMVEELSLSGRCGREIAVVRAAKVELHFLEFFPESGAEVTPREGQQFRWQNVEGDMPAELLPNDRPVWEILKKEKNC